MRGALARWWPWALAIASVVVAAVVVGPQRSGEPFDPRSTDPAGAAGIVDVLRELDRPVAVGTVPGPDTGAFLVLRDQLDREARAEVGRWLTAGGRLVVADPASPLLRDVVVDGRLATDVIGATDVAPACADPELRGVDAVHSATWVSFAPAAGDRSCFPLEGGAWLVRRSVGAGELVALGGADAFRNGRLGDADNALLLVRLLGRDGGVVVADASPPGGGEATLGELVPTRVYVALAMLALAFVLVAWARGRRLGAPVEEQLPVRIPASELVLATADLMRRGQVRDAAGAALRAELRGDASLWLGIPEDAPDEVLAARIAAWTGADAAGVATALARGPVPDDEALVGLARTVARLRQRLAGGQLASPGPDGPSTGTPVNAAQGTPMGGER
ncbi:MAG: hypothetical protein KY461_09460 [Actinobacteria bacterium]|nr:hypothetical protein [Actinomycetota bacterium]